MRERQKNRDKEMLKTGGVSERERERYHHDGKSNQGVKSWRKNYK